MSFLQWLSSTAEHVITFHCKNTIAHTNPRGNTKKAIAFMSWNDLKIKKGGKSKYEVIKDDCKLRKDTWAESVFKIETEKVTRLPIVDVQVKDFGGERQVFKIEVGKVCFSHYIFWLVNFATPLWLRRSVRGPYNLAAYFAELFTIKYSNVS